MAEVVQSESKITYSYVTVRMTQSRIDKGLIAIPKGLATWFPERNDTIQVYLNNSPVSQTKRYSSYSSSTRECRIGGVKEWFEQNKIKSGDEIVLQLIDRDHRIYRLIPERNFLSTAKELEYGLDHSETEEEASGKILTLSQWTNLDKSKTVLNEYHRLSASSISIDRHYSKRSLGRARESAPANLRFLLGQAYKGHCQVCDFWFLKRNKEPYFEIHHLDPLKSHHPKNLLVVCGNCHNQFEHAELKQVFDDSSWLIKVSFNQTTYPVKQVALIAKLEPFSKKLFA